jgi:predicted RNA-binding Zn ribbon-like protein
VLPSELELPLAFVNTLDVEDAVDRFGNPAALRSWLIDRGLIGSDARVTRRDLGLAIELRDALRHALIAHAGIDSSTHEVAGVNRTLARFPVGVRVDETGSPQLEPRGAGVAGALGRVVCDMNAAQSRGTWDRLKLCPAEDCLWAFFDASKNRSRRWCSMNVCGNRTKTREYRRRRAAHAHAAEGTSGASVEVRRRVPESTTREGAGEEASE